MTTKSKESLIGYDPLAWMNDASDESDASSGDTSADMPDSVPAEKIISPDASMQELSSEVPVAEGMAEVSVQPPPVTTKPDSSKISLDATLNIHNVAQLQEQVINALHGNEQLEIDVSAVNAVDTASMQLLVVLKQEAIKSNKEVIFDFPSDKFIEAAELLGIAEMLAVDQAAAGFF